MRTEVSGNVVGAAPTVPWTISSKFTRFSSADSGPHGAYVHEESQQWFSRALTMVYEKNRYADSRECGRAVSKKLSRLGIVDRSVKRFEQSNQEQMSSTEGRVRTVY